MARRSFFSFLKRAGIGSESVSMIELSYPSSKSKTKTKVEDYSKVELVAGDYITPKLDSIIASRPPQIPIIGIGGTGVRIVSQIGSRLAQYDINFPIMGIETDKGELEKQSHISNKYLVPGTNSGTAKQYRVGSTLAKANKEELLAKVNEYITSLNLYYEHEMVFLIFGSGGTGVGIGLELAEMLIEQGKRPVPFFVLPSREENTRIKFTSAVALYKLSYGPKSRCLNLTTICIDNDYFLEKNSKQNYASILYAINERIGATIADLILSTESVSDGYSADLNEFLEIFRNIRGIGSLVYLHSGGDFNNLKDFFNSKKDLSRSMELDLYTSTRSYFFIQATEGTVTAKDFREIILEFNNSDIFPKFIESQDEVNNFEIRGIFTGIKLSQKIEDLMQMAQDARVSILNKEIENTVDGKLNPKIDRLKEDEELEVKTGEELGKERSEEYAKMRRDGHIS